MKPFHFIPLSIMFLVSCNEEKPVSPKPVGQKLKWTELGVYLDQQRVHIFNNSDSAIFTRYDYRDSVTSRKPLGIVHIPTHVKSSTFVINQKDRDSVAGLIYDQITKPVYTSKRATCYAGYVDLELMMGETTLSCSFSSAGDWSTVSNQTSLIYRLLKSKINVSEQ